MFRLSEFQLESVNWMEATYRKYIPGIQNSGPILSSKFEGTPWNRLDNTSVAAYGRNRTI
jgi:hypothetical protein